MRVLGVDPRRNRWALRKRVRYVAPGEAYEPDIGTPSELLVREGMAGGLPALPGTTVVFVTSEPRLAATADRIGFLREGRLVREEEGSTLDARFRRIRYSNEMTETRTEYGNELDSFDAVRVKVRGWGIDAVVSNFDEAAFDRFRATEGVKDAVALPLTAEEIFEAVVG